MKKTSHCLKCLHCISAVSWMAANLRETEEGDRRGSMIASASHSLRYPRYGAKIVILGNLMEWQIMNFSM